MIDLIPFTDTRVIGLRISGKVRKEQYAEIEKICDERLKIHPKLRIYCEFHNFKGITLPALMEDIRYSLPNLTRFEKEALVADKGWITKFAEIGNKVFHSIDVKHFLPEEKEDAFAWIQE